MTNRIRKVWVRKLSNNAQSSSLLMRLKCVILTQLVNGRIDLVYLNATTKSDFFMFRDISIHYHRKLSNNAKSSSLLMRLKCVILTQFNWGGLIS